MIDGLPVTGPLLRPWGRTLQHPLLAALAPGTETLVAAAGVQSDHGILWASARRGVPVPWLGAGRPWSMAAQKM